MLHYSELWLWGGSDMNLNRIKEFFKQKVNYKHFIGLGIILFICGFLVYFKSQEINYMSISTIGMIVTIISGFTHYVKNNKQELKRVVLGSGLLVFTFYFMAMFAKQMYRSTNIDTAVWLNCISAMVSAIIGAGISGFISFLLVSRQIKISNESSEKQIMLSNESLEKQISENKRLTTYTLEEAKKETDKKNNNVALNYIYLINTEMALHRELLITYIYYKCRSDLISSDLDDIFKSLDSKKWDRMFVECAKCFSNKLMIDLSGYYYGIETLKELELNDNQKKDTIESQLISMYKCINIIEIEFNEKLRKKDVYCMDGKKVRVDKKTGELIIK